MDSLAAIRLARMSPLRRAVLAYLFAGGEAPAGFLEVGDAAD